MTEESRDILEEPDKGVRYAEGVLARLFRQILDDVRIGGIQWAALMNKYLDDPRNGVPRNGKDRSSARGNLNKELRRPRMTWKVFRKALVFLRPVNIRFEIHMTWANKRTTIHSVSLTGAQYEDFEGDDAIADIGSEDSNE